MSENNFRIDNYFLYDLQLNAGFWASDALPGRLRSVPSPPPNYGLNAIADCAARQLGTPVRAGTLALLSALNAAFMYITERYLRERHVRLSLDRVTVGDKEQRFAGLSTTLTSFVAHFPPAPVVTGESAANVFFSGRRMGARQSAALAQMFILAIQSRNPALAAERLLIDDEALQRQSGYRLILEKIDRLLVDEPSAHSFDLPLLELLSLPLRHAPDDLAAQLAYVRTHWAQFLPEELLARLLTALDIWQEERRLRGAGPGPTPVPEFTEESQAEPRSYSLDADWMPNVVLMAKSIHVWLDQLSKKYKRHLRRLDEIPDAELDRLACWNITGLWLIGIWKRSRASKRIKQMRGNPDAEASAYSLYDYAVSDELGGDQALDNLRDRCAQRGIRLACDMVPNHTGICSRWIVEHPDWFIQTDLPPYPGYRFSGPDLCERDEVSTVIEDGYWDHSEAAVVFKHFDHRSGKECFIYHGNDGTHLPWNDTAQLNFLLPEVRQAVLREIIDIARRFPIIRFDAAMTLTKKHFQRLWYPQPGGGAGVPSRADFWMSRQDFDRAFPVEFWREVVDRIAAEAPDTLLLAEAFWLMEGFFVRTLGMHRVYNSAFMNMLKTEDNERYRSVIKNILEFDPEILKRFVNFMSNPDEETAIEQFGTGDKYFGVAILLVTLPGLPMFAHGQVEGLREKYGMEYPRAYWDEAVDEGLLHHHETMLFPLLGRRRLFSEAEHFTLYDFFTGGTVNEDVFAFSNRRHDQRALVVYHNRHAQTTGWVRTACARKAADEGGLEHATFSSALDLAGDDIFWRFRDHCTGLSYLRSARQLGAEGLFLQLGPYQAHVFVDFERLEDPEGDWQALWQRLDGRPVADLDRERRIVRYAALHRALRQALESLGEPKKLTAGVLAPLLGEMATETGRQLDGETLRASLRRDLGRLPAEASRSQVAIAAPLVLLGHLAAPVGLDADRFDRFLLEDPLHAWLRESTRSIPEEEAERLIRLLRSLVLWQRRLAEAPPVAALGSLLEERGTRRLIGCNLFEGHVWFSKEGMELLLSGMEFAARLFHAPAAGRPLRKKLKAWLTACEQSGYRLDKFLRLL